MKKFLKLTTLAAALLIFTVCFASCGTSGNVSDNSGECFEHTFGEWTPVGTGADVTCGSSETYVRQCTNCPCKEYENRYVDHNFTYVPGKDANCVESGYSDHQLCTRCGFTDGKSEWGPDDNHKSPVTVPGEEAGYGKNGLTDGEMCDACGEIITEREIIYGTYDVNVTVMGGGKVNSGADCDISHPVTVGEHVYLSASADSNYRFVGWFFNGEYVSNYVHSYGFDMPEEHVEVLALFIPTTENSPSLSYGEKYFIVEVIAEENGSVDKTFHAVPEGDSVTLSAEAENGYSLAGWYIGDELISKKKSFEFTPEGNCSVTARFGVGNYKITVNTSDHITVSGAEETFVYDESVTLTATLDKGYTFDGWYLDGELVSTELIYRFRMPNGDITLEARRKPVAVSNIELSGGDTADVDVGKKEIAFVTYPDNAEYSKLEFSIKSGAEQTGAAIDGSTVTFTSTGEIVLLVKVLDENGETLSEHETVLYVFSTHIGSVEIANTDNVILLGESVKIDLDVYPPTAYPRDDYIFQLAANTCGAKITDGVLTVTQPGSVRVRVRVDDSDWSSYFVFNVPVTVSTPEEFNSIRNNLSGYYILGADIDLSGYPEWQPIGYAENSSMGLTYDKAFKGYINGNGFKITGLNIDVSKTEYLTVGLFGAVDNSARVLDLTVEDYRVTGIAHESVVYLGAVAGIVNGKITGLKVSGYVDTFGASYVGGAIGQLFGELSGSSVDTELVVGGGSGLRVGGAVAYYANGTFSDCTVTAKLLVATSGNTYVGSVAGEADGKIDAVTLVGSEIDATLGGTSYVGSYVGYTSYSLLSDVTVKGSIRVNAQSIYVGGIAGYIQGAENCSYEGTVLIDAMTSGYVGGAFGYAAADLKGIAQNIGEIEIEASDLYFGSIAGYVNGNVSDSDTYLKKINVISTGNVALGGAAGYVGGKASNISVKIPEISVSASSIDVGGVVGNLIGAAENCKFSGNITADAKNYAYVGGIAGQAGSVKNCDAYSIQSVMTASSNYSTYVGGVVGSVGGATENVYFYGQITLAEGTVCKYAYVGGISGKSGQSITDAASTAIIDVNVSQSYNLYLGGISGYAKGVTEKAKADGEINVIAVNKSYVGGVVGYAYDGIAKSYSVGMIKASVSAGDLYLGGIAGHSQKTIDECYYSYGDLYGTATSYVYSGGIAGISYGNINNSYTSYSYILTDMSKQGTKAYLGGIVGLNDGYITNCYSICYVDGRADGSGKTLYVGGIAGCNSGTLDRCFTKSASGEYIRENISVSDIETTALNSATIYAGGLVGYGESGTTVKNCYTENALLTRNSFAGGLIGYNAGGVQNSISYSSILGVLGEKVGAFVGNSASGASYKGCYFSVTVIGEDYPVGTGISDGILAKTDAELRGTSVYADFSTEIWSIVNGKKPSLIFSSDIWQKNREYGYNELLNVLYPEDQHSYPEPDSYLEIRFDVGEGEEKIAPIYIHAGEGLFITAIPKRIGYTFGGWFFDEVFVSSADSDIIFPDGDITLYAKWIPIVYDLTVETDGRGEVSYPDSFIYKDKITLTATDKKGDFEFLGWFADGTLVSSEKVYTFIADASDISVTAVFLDCYDLGVKTNSDAFGRVTVGDDDERGAETLYYTVNAVASRGYTFVGWFEGDRLISREATFNYRMPSHDVILTARFTSSPETAAEWDGSIADGFFSGTGTEADPYVIFDAQELAYLAKTVNAGTAYNNCYFRLANNIYLGDNEWTPIGRNSRFSGHFNGNGYTVYGGKITVNTSLTYYVGLFGFVSEGSVENLALDGFTVKADLNSNNERIGGIAASLDNKAEVRNCYANVDIDVSYRTRYVGGIVGYAQNGTVRNCVSEGSVHAYHSYSSTTNIYVGGVVGYGEAVYGCVSFADVSAENNDSSASYYINVGAVSGLKKSLYRYEGQTILNNDEEVALATNEILIPLFTSESEKYMLFAMELGFDTSAWNLYSIGEANAPSLAANYYQIFTESQFGKVNYTDFVGSIISLEAIPDTGYTFIGWYRNGKLLFEAPYYTAVLSVSATVEARYEKTDYVFSVSSSHEGVGVESDEKILHYLDTVTLKALFVEGYEFLGWYVNGELVTAELEYRFQMPDGGVTALASYCKYYNVTVSVKDGVGSVSGAATVYETDIATVTATVGDGYKFFGWFDASGNCVSTDLAYTFAMPSKNYDLKAVFVPEDENANLGITDPWTGKKATSFKKGNGSRENPYVISSAEELAYLSAKINAGTLSAGAYYTLAADIDLASSTLWTPIGTVEKPFNGHFLGNGYTVSGLKSTTSCYRVGVFGVIGEGASVSGLTVDKIQASCGYSYDYYIGSIAAENYGLIENCSLKTSAYTTLSNSSAQNVYFGGIVGYNHSTGSIVNCASEGYVSAHHYNYGVDAIYIGGIAGYSKGSIASSYVTGYVSGDIYDLECVGGLVGYASGTVTDCYVTGNVSASRSLPSVGGLIGELYALGSVQRCFATGSVSVNTNTSGHSFYVGGLIGYCSGSVSDSFAIGTVSGKNSSNDAEVGALVGGGGSRVTNSYVLSGQEISDALGAVSHNSIGTVTLSEVFNTKEFYNETLGFSSVNWKLDEINVSEAKLPTLILPESYEYRATVGVSYNKVTVRVEHVLGEGGEVNLSEYMLANGVKIKLLATVPSGMEFVGWFVGGNLVSEETEFLYKPTRDTEIVAKFDIVRFTFAPVIEDGVSVSDYTERNYEGDTVTVTASVSDGYVFNGWYLAKLIDGSYVADTLITDEFTYTFTMPGATYVVIAVSTPIDYNLSVSVGDEKAGGFTASHTLIHVNDKVTLSYNVNSGYRFLGWYAGDELLSSSKTYTFTAPASDVSVTAKTELIPYTLTVGATLGGKVSSTGGSYTVVDEITLIATENKGYDFIGWYYGEKLVSDSLTYTFTMPARDHTLEARFTEAYVTLTVNPGFNGSAEGSTTIRKNGEATVKASPDEGYRFGGWYVNGTLASEELEYTAAYDVSGEYNVYALFVPLGIHLTYYSEGTQVTREEITDAETYLVPYLYREGYRFDGWYTDNETFEKPLVISNVTQNTDVFAKWSELDSVNEVYSELPVTHTIEVYSRLSSEELVAKAVSIKNNLGEDIEVIARATARPGYYLISAEYDTGATYTVEIAEGEVFVTDGIRSFILVFERDEVEEVTYSSEVVTFTVKDIKQKRPNNTGLTLVTDKLIKVGDVLYCTNDPEGCLGYVESVTVVNDNTYDVIFSSEEVDPALILSRLNVNQKDVPLGLENAEIEGDVEAALEMFAIYAIEASRVNDLCYSLRELADKDKSFSFGEPKAEPKLTVKGNKIEIGVTITVEGERKDAEGNVRDKFAIRVQVGIINTLSSKCDVDVNVAALSIDNFYFELANTTTVYFNVDVVYGATGSDANYDALEMLLVNYKETIAEKKELPFDLESECEKTFDDLEIPISIPIGATCLTVDITITPFIRYNVIGQLDINTSFTVTNTCALVYVDGAFDICYNCDTKREVSIYALAYCRLEAGINVEASLYISGLKKLLNAFIFFEAGPYVEAAGALIYEDQKLDLAGYVEWGYFYDWGVGVRVLGKTFDYDPDKVSKRLGYVGTYYLYIEFTDEEEEYTVDEYTIEIFENFDHELYAFDLNTFAPVQKVGERDDYRYFIAENPYVYVDAFDYLRIKTVPREPVAVVLNIYIGNLAVKTVNLTLDINEYQASAKESSYGYIQLDKTMAAVGQSVSFRFVRSDDNVIVRYWKVNGVKVDKPYLSITVPMTEGGITVEAVAERISDKVYYIDSVSDFELLRAYPSGVFIQTADIDFDGRYVEPIPEFRGTYYGNGYKLSNMVLHRLDAGEKSYIGLIAKATSARFYGMRIEGAYGTDYGNYNTTDHTVYYGTIVAYGNNVAFYDCTVTDVELAVNFSGRAYLLAYAKDLSTRMGGIIGYSEQYLVMDSCSVNDCTFRSTISSVTGWGAIGRPAEDNVVGGLVGEARNKIKITDSYVDGEFTVDNSWNGTSKLYVGGVVGMISNVRVSGKIYEVTIANCLTDFTVSQTNDNSKRFVSAAVGAYGQNTSASDVHNHSDKLFTVSDSYTMGSGVWDGVVEDFEKGSIYTDDFVYNVLGFDPMMWSVIEGTIVKKDI